MTKKMDKMSAEAKSEWQKLADDYSETRKQIAAELGELKVKSGEAWKTGKKKVDSAMEKLEREYRELKKRYF